MRGPAYIGESVTFIDSLRITTELAWEPDEAMVSDQRTRFVCDSLHVAFDKAFAQVIIDRGSGK
jgi:hypothetical protein